MSTTGYIKFSNYPPTLPPLCGTMSFLTPRCGLPLWLLLASTTWMEVKTCQFLAEALRGLANFCEPSRASDVQHAVSGPRLELFLQPESQTKRHCGVLPRSKYRVNKTYMYMPKCWHEYHPWDWFDWLFLPPLCLLSHGSVIVPINMQEAQQSHSHSTCTQNRRVNTSTFVIWNKNFPFFSFSLSPPPPAKKALRIWF